jgi:uncharacterized protein (DUF1778 family)
MLALATFESTGLRDDRMEQRVSRADKGLIERAAALQGLRASEFVTSAAITAARDTLTKLSTTVLKEEDVAAFMQAFEEGPPNEELVNLFRLHKEVTGT